MTVEDLAFIITSMMMTMTMVMMMMLIMMPTMIVHLFYGYCVYLLCIYCVFPSKGMLFRFLGTVAILAQKKGLWGLLKLLPALKDNVGGR